MTLLSYAGEYMAFTSILAWLYNLLTLHGVDPLEAYGFGFLVSSAYLLVSGVLAVPFGTLCDRFGRRPLAIIGCLVAGIAILVLPVTSSLSSINLIIGVISVILVLVGIGHGTYTASALAYAGDISSESDVGQAYGLIETAEYSMFMFGTPLGFVIAALYGNTSTFIITGGILILAALTAAIGMPERRNGVLTAVTSIGAGITWDTGRSAVDPRDGAGAPNSPGQVKMLYQAVGDIGVITALFAVLFVSIGFTAFRIYMTQYGATGQAVPFVGPYLVSIMAAASVLSAVPIGKFVDLSRKRVPLLIVGFVLEAISLALILLGPTAFSLIIWSVVFGVAIMLVRVPQAVIVAERTTFQTRAGAMGANHAVEHVGYGVGAFLGGFFALSFGFNFLTSFAIFGVISLGAALALVLLWKKMNLK